MTETAALARPKPHIDHREALERVAGRLAAAFDPVAIMLFGSRARGEAWRDSDYDLMVVLHDDHPRDGLQPHQWWHIVRGERIDANVVFSRESSYAWRRHEVGTLEYEVEADGVQLCPPTGRVFTSDRPEEAGVAKGKIVREWLEQVQRDLFAAIDCIHGPNPVPDRGAFHVQQAAEKLAKAALVAHRVRPERTHEIAHVVAQLPGDFALRQRFAALDRFSDYAIAFRYPDGGPTELPSATEVEAWIAEIETLKADFERWLGERG